MPAAKNLEGQTFGRLLVLCRNGTKDGRVLWDCRCQCGTAVLAVSNALTAGHTKSCGCWRDERNRSTEIKHGHATRSNGHSPTYRTWQAMLTRCTNINVPSYKDYGARGISVHPAWLVFENFLTDMGVKPKGTSIERKDNEKGYRPDNCKWATKTEQARNTRANKHIEYRGKRMTQAEFSETIGHKHSTVIYRIRAGWTAEQIANTPVHMCNRITSKPGDEVDVPDDLQGTTS